jgi:hypothetical protein
MTMPDFTRIEEQMRAAKDALDEAMEHAVRELARFERENRPTEEERRALQEAALRGDLGADMRTLARRVDSGEDTWDAIFAGESPYADLLGGHLDRMISANREAIAQAIEEGDDFDPHPEDPDQTGRS